MEQKFDLQAHIDRGVERIVADTLRATLKNPAESAFMSASRRPAARRPSGA